MRYLCNIGDSLLTSGICAWCLALPWYVCIFVLETRRSKFAAVKRRSR